MEWKTSQGLVPYPEAVSFMESRIEAMAREQAEEMVWLLEHPPLYTAGTSARGADLLDAGRFPVYKTGRGGEYTYHGPGQRIAYVMLDLKRLFAPEAPDLRAYVQMLERWIIATLAELGVEGFVREGRVGVWVNRMLDDRCWMIKSTSPSSIIHHPSSDFGEAKIAALGVRVRKWVSYHGIAINVNPELSHYAGIVPCGIRDAGVTSLKAMGVKAGMKELDAALRKSFGGLFPH